MHVSARIARIILIAALVIGPAMTFAAPMPAAHAAPGKMTMSASVERGADCKSCPRHDDGMGPGHCDAACAWLAALPASSFVSEKPVAPAWAMGEAAVPLSVALLVDPYPPRFSSKT